MEDQASEKQTNGQKRKEVKFRRKDNRCLENVLRAVSSLSEKEIFEELKVKYVELYDQVRVAHGNLYSMETKTKAIQRQLDLLKSDHNKSLLARSRLEGLCRELQKQNKIIKDENLTKIREAEEVRKEFAAKFQNALSEVTNMMHENNEKTMKLRDDNIDMATKITSLCQDFQKGEQEIARMSKQMELEKQLSEATISKLQYELKSEREFWTKEREMLNENLKKSEETCQQLQTNVHSLENYAKMYSGKYEEFESTISKSSKIFDDCKSEMGKMNKRIQCLDKEAKLWKARSEHNTKLVMDLTSIKEAQDIEHINMEKKVEQLQKLCRQLQVDRAAYLKLLKSNGIEPSTQICVDPVTANNQEKPTDKEKKLEVLKNNLKVLQEQFAGLTVQKVNHFESADKNKFENLESLVDTNDILLTGEVNDVEGLSKDSKDSNETANEPPNINGEDLIEKERKDQNVEPLKDNLEIGDTQV